MKITVIGGGAHRVLGIMRAIMAVPKVMSDGEISLYDLNPVRAEAMGRMLLKTPEQSESGCRITWGATLEESLEGADIVNVILPAADRRPFYLARSVCARHGFISSDNVSPTGAMCAVAIAPVLLHIARTMEKICPQAWLVNFVNPVAVISGMINNHTCIRTLGVCQGFTNHLWDIPRIFGNDEQAQSLRSSLPVSTTSAMSYGEHGRETTCSKVCGSALAQIGSLRQSTPGGMTLQNGTLLEASTGWYGSGANWVSLFFHPNKTGWIISNTIRLLNVCARSVRTLLAHNSTPSSKDTLHGERRMTDLSKRA